MCLEIQPLTLVGLDVVVACSATEAALLGLSTKFAENNLFAELYGVSCVQCALAYQSRLRYLILAMQ